MVIAPAFGFGNFIMLIYLTLNFDVPLYVFAPLVAVAVVVGLVLAGKAFRDKQQPTDMNMNYFRAQEALTSTYILWEQIMAICQKSGTPLDEKFVKRLNRIKEAAKK